MRQLKGKNKKINNKVYSVRKRYWNSRPLSGGGPYFNGLWPHLEKQLKIRLKSLDKSRMNKRTPRRFPNLFDLILTEPKKFSLPAFIMTYILLPLMITIAVITTGVVLPSSTVAAIFLFVAIFYSNGLIGLALAFGLPKLDSKKRSGVHLLASTLMPFALWRVSVLILFNY